MKPVSAFFSRYDPTTESNKEFRSDLKKFLDFSVEQRRACVQGCPVIKMTTTKTEEEIKIRELAQATGLTQLDISAASGIISFFLDRLISITEDAVYEGDDVDKWIADLDAFGLLTEAEKPALSEALQSLKTDVLPSYQAEMRRRAYTSGVFPHLKSFGSTVELRAVQQTHFDWANDPANYITRISGLTPVASIHIGLSRAEPAHFHFQLDPDDLRRLINCLLAVEKDIIAVKDLYPKVSTESQLGKTDA